jgi:hypothetical protein
MDSRDQFFYSVSMPMVITKTHNKYLQVKFNSNIVFNLKYFVHHSDILIVFMLIISNMNFTMLIYFEVSFV